MLCNISRHNRFLGRNAETAVQNKCGSFLLVPFYISWDLGKQSRFLERPAMMMMMMMMMMTMMMMTMMVMMVEIGRAHV